MSFQTAAVAVIVGACIMLALRRMLRFFRRGHGGAPCCGCTQCERETRGGARPPGTENRRRMETGGRPGRRETGSDGPQSETACPFR